jgi:hypothetical protein
MITGSRICFTDALYHPRIIESAHHLPPGSTPAEQGEAAGRKEAAIRKPKTHPAHDRKGREIRVTIPEG